MAKTLVYYAHPGHRFSRVNAAMAAMAQALDGITFVDLYASYPRHNIAVDAEQQRLRDHDVIVFQFPLFWYSSPSLVKEWQDLVLEHGFAYGEGGTALSGKTMMLAITTAGAADAYRPEGYQNFPLRSFLTPFQQTATLCKMRFAAPYVLHGALRAPDTDGVAPHVEGYRQLLQALRDDRFDLETACARDTLDHRDLPIRQET